MTNHPRRLGRRKHQRQMDRLLPALRQIRDACTATTKQMRGLQLAARTLGGTWTDLTPYVSKVELR